VKSHLKRNWYWYLPILLLAGGNIYFSLSKKWVQREARIALEREQISCNDKVATVAEHEKVEALKLQSAFYASLLNEDVRDGLWRDVRETMQHIVKETLATEVQFVQNDGKVKVSSTKGNEGNKLEESAIKAMLTDDLKTHVQKTEYGHTISVPISEGSTILGRLLVYHSQLNSNLAPR